MNIIGRFVRGVGAVVAMAAVVGGARPAGAVIKVDFPVSRVYKEATVVAVGELAEPAEGGAVACTVRETLKGKLPETTPTLQVPPDLAGRLKAGSPVVVFLRQQRAILHLDDAWYDADAQGARWAITGPRAMGANFPGRTVALAALVRDLQAGRRSIQDGIGHEFVGGLADRGNLGLRPTFLSAADVDGDGDVDLVVSSDRGTRLFLAQDDRYADCTEAWGLKETAHKHPVAGDVNGDGKLDLLLGKTLWVNGGTKFTPSAATLDLPEETDWAAAALADTDGDKHLDVVVLTKSGKLTTVRNPGAAGKAWTATSADLWTAGQVALAAAFSRDWGDDGAWYVLVVHPADIVRYGVGAAAAPPADFKRLTGVALSDYPKLGAAPWQVDLCAALDYDGNGRTDLLLVTRGGGVTLANRGYGAMMINGFMHQQFRTTSDFKPHPKIPKLPFELGPSLCVTAGKRAGKTGKGNAQNLLLLRGDGQLFELANER